MAENNPTQMNPGSQGTGQGYTERGNYTFQCSDVNASCNWSAHGNDPESMREQIARHGREHHNVKEIGEDAWQRIKSFIRPRKAA